MCTFCLLKKRNTLLLLVILRNTSSIEKKKRTGLNSVRINRKTTGSRDEIFFSNQLGHVLHAKGFQCQTCVLFLLNKAQRVSI